MSGYCTLLYSDSYLDGALVLGHALAQLDADRPRIALVTPAVSASAREALASHWTAVQDVAPIVTPHSPELRLLGRPELDTSCTKLHVWGLDLDQAVYLDADTLPLASLDRLWQPLAPAAIAAAPDVGWPDIFNSGVFACRPDPQVFADLKQLAESGSSFDGSDQGVLNEYFKDNWVRLPFTYNVTASASYQYAPAFKRFRKDIRVMHFIGPHKPWSSLAGHGPSSEMQQQWLAAARKAGVLKPASKSVAETDPPIEVDESKLIAPNPRRWDGVNFAPLRNTEPEGRGLLRPGTPAPGSPITEDEGDEDEDDEYLDDEIEEDVFVFPVLGAPVVELPFEAEQRPAERVFY